MRLLYALFIGIPLCVCCMTVGLMLCATVVGAPVGLTVIALGVKMLTL